MPPYTPSHIQILPYTQVPLKPLHGSKFSLDCVTAWNTWDWHSETNICLRVYMASEFLSFRHSLISLKPKRNHLHYSWSVLPVHLPKSVDSILSYLNRFGSILDTCDMLWIIWNRISHLTSMLWHFGAHSLFHQIHTCRDSRTVGQHGLHRCVQWFWAGNPVATVLQWNRYNIK